ncbi:MAG TPA: 3-isopropylmalate dehydratase small subunit [Xanthobacteraceae bacterium]|nr:3-isopropylmalate dehydratase small subunit [Xanthobacteraceae bacterium]
MAEPFTTLISHAVPLLRDNIDTDAISPGSRPQGLGVKTEFSEKGTSRLAEELFANWRYDQSGQERHDFVFNLPQFRSAKILIAGANFGCGSSRESAVWMLKEWGIRCIVAPSIAEIFTNNCFANGLLPVTLPETIVRELADEAQPGAPAALFRVDLSANSLVTPSGRTVGISLPEFRRRALLEGLDELAVTLQDQNQIAGFLVRARREWPWAYQLKALL